MLKGHDVVFDEEIHTQEFNINEVITQTVNKSIYFFHEYENKHLWSALEMISEYSRIYHRSWYLPKNIVILFNGNAANLKSNLACF